MLLILQRRKWKWWKFLNAVELIPGRGGLACRQSRSGGSAQYIAASHLPDTHAYTLIYNQTWLMLSPLNVYIGCVFRGLGAYQVYLIPSNSAPPGHLQFDGNALGTSGLREQLSKVWSNWGRLHGAVNAWINAWIWLQIFQVEVERTCALCPCGVRAQFWRGECWWTFSHARKK